jgi:hypothetical protein
MLLRGGGGQRVPKFRFGQSLCEGVRSLEEGVKWETSSVVVLDGVKREREMRTKNFNHEAWCGDGWWCDTITYKRNSMQHMVQALHMNRIYKRNSMQPLVYKDCYQLPKPHVRLHAFSQEKHNKKIHLSII